MLILFSFLCGGRGGCFHAGIKTFRQRTLCLMTFYLPVLVVSDCTVGWNVDVVFECVLLHGGKCLTFLRP